MKGCILIGFAIWGAGPAMAQGALIKGSDLLLIGDSYIALTRDITRDLEQLARQDGVLAQGDRFRDSSVSGTWMAGGPYPSIPSQFGNAIAKAPVKYVVMNGGGNDVMGADCGAVPTADCPAIRKAADSLKTLLARMGAKGVRKVLFFIYASAVNNPGLNAKVDAERPVLRGLVLANPSPPCYWVDLRAAFSGHYPQYMLADGIHPSAAGSQAAAQTIWDEMRRVDFFGTSGSGIGAPSQYGLSAQNDPDAPWLRSVDLSGREYGEPGIGAARFRIRVRASETVVR
ncbi:MAG: lysophospholipase [Fibrobacteres bacterium]|nr:lysophospholipase [Fibrobacterota bacterium]